MYFCTPFIYLTSQNIKNTPNKKRKKIKKFDFVKFKNNHNQYSIINSEEEKLCMTELSGRKWHEQM